MFVIIMNKKKKSEGLSYFIQILKVMCSNIDVIRRGIVLIIVDYLGSFIR